MIKHFCDKCGEQINRRNQFEYKEVTVAKNIVAIEVKYKTENEAICLECVLDEIKKLDNRLTAG